VTSNNEHYISRVRRASTSALPYSSRSAAPSMTSIFERLITWRYAIVKLPELPGSKRPAKRSSVVFLFERQQSTPSRAPAQLHITPLYPPTAPISTPHCHVVVYSHRPIMSPIHTSHCSATHRQPGGPPTQRLHLPCPRRANTRPSPTGRTQPTPARDEAGPPFHLFPRP